jgi:hypothetical protein
MLKQKDYPGAIRYKRALYELHLTDTLVDGNREDLTARGFCQKTKHVKRIVLLNTLSDKALFETLLHECLHLIEYEEGLEIPHALIERLEAPLAKLLLTNFEISFKRR